MDKKATADDLEIRNLVLAALTPEDRRVLEPSFQFVTLAPGDILYEPGYTIDWVYFPNTAVLSVVTVMADGRAVESDTIGYESVVGVLNALGAIPAISRTFVQIPGTAVRVLAAQVRRRTEESPALRRLLIRHAQANLAQAHQSVACNALHGLDERLCRWLLMSHDRIARDEVHLTQQYLATMLGVQRTTVTEALGQMADAGLVHQGRGFIRIVDRTRMQAMVCECYDAVRGNLQQLIGEEPTNGGQSEY